ncbi:MAG: phosphoribosylanthranilate isomerase [Dehalococcoidia bacterium]|nr:phosphoribosylanthranilate isomerase [Dehalococcoidia bacterium]
MTKVKICGVTQISHALVAGEAGAALIGLNFAPESPRRLSVPQAQEIARALRRRFPGPAPALVGIFVNATAADMRRTAASCSLDWLQLAGEEPWETAAALEQPLIRVVHVAPDETAEGLLGRLAEGARWIHSKESLFLLDAYVAGRHGGTGKTIDWELARRAAREYPLLLSGGLTPENAEQAAGLVQPWGIDVSSGVESGGLKDEAKIRAFLAAVRRADGGLGADEIKKEGRLWGGPGVHGAS